MKKYIYLCFLLACLTSWYSCKKHHPNETRYPFTADQLQWIQCNENSKYKVCTKELDTAGNEIIFIDTLVASTETKTNHTSDVINDEYAIDYYYGSYQFQLGLGDHSFYSIIKIDNEFDFTAKIYLYGVDNVITTYNTDTANINGTVYTDVYKFVNFPSHEAISTTKCYYKKGMGFLYFEDASGVKAEIIQ